MFLHRVGLLRIDRKNPPFITRSQLLTNGTPDKPSYSLLSFITGKTVNVWTLIGLHRQQQKNVVIILFT